MNLSIFKTASVFALCCNALTTIGQVHSTPGGVKGARQWLVADTLAGECFFSSRVLGKPSLKVPNSRSFGWLNHRPSLIVNEANSLSVNLGKETLDKATFFTVYQASDVRNEQLIWTIDKNQKTNLVLTTNRVADIVDYRYMNFTDLAPATPKINIYGQLKSKDSIEVNEQTWHIGKLPASPQLPVGTFNGLVPEIIAFNRVLDREERLKVASYLALKYGITLTETSTTYVNSAGETIWNGEKTPIYHHNIAGIGRDDASGWVQKIASSSNCPSLLSISTASIPTNNHFLLWGDNDLKLSPATKLPGIPTLLKRTWLLAMHGKNSFGETKIVLDTKQVYAPIPQNPVFWMAIDSTGKEGFSASNTQYVKMDKLDLQGFAHFKVFWKNNQTPKQHFSFMVAQSLLLATTILPPSCSKPESGQFQVKILGGQAPYHLNVINQNTERSINRQIQDSRFVEQLDGLPAGKYLLTVKDALQQVYADSFWVNPAEVPLPQGLSDIYEISASKAIQLNAADKMPSGVAYHWLGPDNFESISPSVELSQAGTYTLTTTQNGCSSTREILVNGPQTSIFHSEVVYPNPSNGVFNVKIILNKPAAVSLSVYSTEGKLVLFKSLAGDDHYVFSEQLTTNGLYFIVLQSDNAITTSKLLIVR